VPIYLDDGEELQQRTLRRLAAMPWKLWGPSPAPAPPASSPTLSAVDAALARTVHRCRTCEYSRVGDDGERECRRHTPQVITIGAGDGYATVWPRVGDFDWCGEYRQQ
jgi:hypothetical protein